MRINFAQFPIYDGIKKEKLIASNITEAFGDWIYKNVAGLKAHLLAEKIFKSTAEGVEIDEEEVDIISRAGILSLVWCGVAGHGGTVEGCRQGV